MHIINKDKCRNHKFKQIIIIINIIQNNNDTSQQQQPHHNTHKNIDHTTPTQKAQLPNSSNPYHTLNFQTPVISHALNYGNADRTGLFIIKMIKYYK